ncbi:transmembrane protein 186 isoform X2 [Macrobrachium rosenbergii]|uniref:transmembrane protein 186 isoform X2 n=1 Tax=Macrobrachium rosenbergii TaxID=79674 RepID=UPI0034D63B32
MIYPYAMLRVLCTRWSPKRNIQLGNIFPCTQGPSRPPRASSSSSYPPKKYESEKNVNSLKGNGEFEIIYKFPYISLVRGICRLKIYQSAATLVALPAVSYLTHLGTLTTQDLNITLSISGLALFMLFVMGELFRKVIGHIYYCSQKNLVKISHLTFWGRRQDIIVPREDLVPISDTTEYLRDIYVRVRRYSEPNNSHYLSLRFGGITNLESFIHVFGELEHPSQRYR